MIEAQLPAFIFHPVFIVIGAFTVLQMLQIVVVYRRLIKHKPIEDLLEKDLPLTVVICAKDEVKNLTENLPHWLMQQHKNYELIVVDDQSEDGSAELLKEYSQHFKHLKVITIDQNVNAYRGKKLALTLAFKSAKNDILVLTDADCKPASPIWLRYMQKPFANPHTEIVLGYSPYRKKASLLNGFIRYETFITAMNYISFALNKNPYMGVGRNLAYRKELFFEHKGFAPFLHLPSGDDDLFVNTHATKNNTEVVLHPSSFMLSEPEDSWKAWRRQKHRHLSVGRHYKLRHKLALGYLFSSAYIYYLCVAAACFFPGVWLPVLCAFALRMIVWMIYTARCGKRLFYKNIWVFSQITDVIYNIFYLPLFGLAIRLTKKKTYWR